MGVKCKYYSQIERGTIGSGSGLRVHGTKRGGRIISNHLLGVFTRHTAIRATIARATTTHTHAHRGLVHIVVIHDLTTQHTRARAAFAKDRRGVTPEVAAVGGDTAGEWVAWPSSLGSIAKTVSRRREERVDAQQRRPLCAEAVSPARWTGTGECWVGSCAGGSEAGALEGGCAGSHGRGEGLRAWV